MNIYLTYDYELYFGANTGTVHDCLLHPTNELLRIANAHNAKITLFVDAGFIHKLQQQSEQFPQLKTDYELIRQQLANSDMAGHAVQLHIHPHWEDSYYDGTQWIMKTERYKLSDFSKPDAHNIIINYTKALQNCIHTPITAFRAGGWCAQPFEHFATTLQQLNITTDSSVFVGGKNTLQPYEYDYTTAPKLDIWRFASNVIEPVANGVFTQLPIASYQYLPLFYWNLFVRGKLNKLLHSTIGKGSPITQANFKTKVLCQGMLFCACADGYYTSKLPTIIKRNATAQHLVIIGHPKAQTVYSLQQTDVLLKQFCATHRFVAMR